MSMSILDIIDIGSNLLDNIPLLIIIAIIIVFVVIRFAFFKRPQDKMLEKVFMDTTNVVNSNFPEYCFYHPPSSVRVITDKDNALEQVREFVGKVEDAIKRKDTEIIILTANDDREQELKIMVESVKYLGELYADLINHNFLTAVRIEQAKIKAREMTKPYLVDMLSAYDNEYSELVRGLQTDGWINKVVFPLARDILQTPSAKTVNRTLFMKLVKGIKKNVSVAIIGHRQLNYPYLHSYQSIGTAVIKSKIIEYLLVTTIGGERHYSKMQKYVDIMKKTHKLIEQFNTMTVCSPNSQTEVFRFWILLKKLEVHRTKSNQS